MAADPSLALQKAVYAALVGRPALTALIGGSKPRVYDSVPAGAALPYVTIGQDQITSDYEAGADFSDCHAIVHVWSAAPGLPEVKRIVAEVRAALEAQLAVEGFAVCEWECEDVQYLPLDEDNTRHAALQFFYKVLAAAQS